MEAVDSRSVFNRSGNWTTRATVKPTSVVQTLLNRQLGLPHFSRHGDVTDCVSVRQMFKRRLPSDEKGKPVKAVKVDLKPGNSLPGYKKIGSTWTQLSVPDKTEISVIDTKIWVRWKDRDNNDKAMEALYVVEEPSPPSPDGLKKRTQEQVHSAGNGKKSLNLKCTQQVHSAGNGKMKAKYTFGSRSLSNERSALLYMSLIEPGILRAYDLVKKKIMQDLALPLSISPGIKGYTDLAIFDNSKKIFLMGTQKKMTKVIILLNYPPWTEIGIIHVDIPVKISIQDGVCFLFKEKEKCLEVTTWPLLFKKVDMDPPTARVIVDDSDPPNQVICTREGRLKEFPTILSKIRVQTDYCGAIDMGIPLFFGAVKSGMNFYEFHRDPLPVHEFVGVNQEEPTEVFQFPSATCKVLICSHFSGQSQTVEFMSEWNGRKNQKSLKVTALPQAFKPLENPRPSTNVTVRERRPRRSCVNNNRVNDEQSSKIPILGIAYCSIMDYLAVLTADEEMFHVAIYDTLKLQPVEKLDLPSVLAWPRVKDDDIDDVNPKRSSIENVEFNFEAEFILVGFQYSASCKPRREVYYTRLLSEKLSY